MPPINFSCQVNFSSETTIQSTTPETDLGPIDFNRVHIELLENPIESFGPWKNQYRIVRFDAGITLINSNSLKLLGNTNRTISVNNEVATYISDEDGNWTELTWSREAFAAAMVTMGGTTEEWVNGAIAEFAITVAATYVTPSDVDSSIGSALSSYATAATVNSAIATAVSDALESITSVYATPASVDSAISSALGPYATTTGVDTAISSALGPYATITGVDTAIGTALVPYSTTTQVGDAIVTALTPYQTGADVDSAISLALQLYYTSSGVDDAIVSALIPYITATQVGSAISDALVPYYTSAQVDSTIGTSLLPYPTAIDVTTQIGQAISDALSTVPGPVSTAIATAVADAHAYTDGAISNFAIVVAAAYTTPAQVGTAIDNALSTVPSAVSVAIAASLSDAQAYADGAVAALSTSVQATYATKTELSGEISGEVTNRNSAIAASLSSAQAYADGAVSTFGSAVAATYATQTALSSETVDRNNAIDNAVDGEAAARDDAIGNAIAGEVTNRNTAISASVTEEATARATAVGAVASDVEVLQTKIGSYTNTATIGAVVTNLYAAYSIKLDVNGHVSGIMLNNDGTTASMIIDGDLIVTGTLYTRHLVNNAVTQVSYGYVYDSVNSINMSVVGVAYNTLKFIVVATADGYFPGGPAGQPTAVSVYVRVTGPGFSNYLVAESSINGVLQGTGNCSFGGVLDYTPADNNSHDFTFTASAAGGLSDPSCGLQIMVAKK